jgi:hypothetical protein
MTDYLKKPYNESIVQRERELLEKHGLDPTKIVISGTALSEVPHGFVCFYGTQAEMELLVTKFIGERGTLAMAVPNVPTELWDIRLKAASQFVPVNEYMFVIWEREKWTIPGGKRRMGESSHQCATRELKEETGFSMAIPDLKFYLDDMKAYVYVFRPREFLDSIHLCN